MGNRLSKIYTKTGDNGTTGLGDNTRIDKDAPRMHAIGDVDELNSAIGILMSELPENDELSPLFLGIQHALFDIGGELSMPGYSLFNDALISQLEESIDDINALLPPLKNFILPGGSKAASYCHLCRSICRRAERQLITLMKLEQQIPSSPAIRYLNRLSDLLFVIARILARRDGQQEILWQNHYTKG